MWNYTAVMEKSHGNHKIDFPLLNIHRKWREKERGEGKPNWLVNYPFIHMHIKIIDTVTLIKSHVICQKIIVI